MVKYNQSCEGRVEELIKDKNLVLYNLYKNYYDMAYRCAYCILRNKVLAEDAVHEAFIRVYNKMDQLKHLDRIVQWMIAIVKNCAFAQLKKQNKLLSINDFSCFHKEIWDKDLLDVLEEREIRRIIINIISRELDKCYQQVIILRYYHNFSYEDIARLLNIKIGTVKSRIYRAKRIIARSLEKQQLLKRADHLIMKVETFQ
ncbi:MAG: RNA polymerase sigma factor [Clostridiales bacterium]|nr:RNA polymerase sigma factor [Clostridiales bacterium]